MNLLWLDLETGGIETWRPILEIAALETNIAGRAASPLFHAYVDPEKREIAPEAQKVNEYDPQLWAARKAEPWAVVEKRLAVAFRGRGPFRLAGWNVEFDRSFLRARGVEVMDRCRHHALDLMSMAWCLLVQEEKPSLGKLTVTLGVTALEPHTARGDVAACVGCYRALRQHIEAPSSHIEAPLTLAGLLDESSLNLSLRRADRA